MTSDQIQREVFPTDVQLRRIDPVRNMRRYYRMSVQRDLLGDVTLVREWGRIGARGQIKIDTYRDEGQAVTALMKLATLKRRRGYKDQDAHEGLFLRGMS